MNWKISPSLLLLEVRAEGLSEIHPLKKMRSRIHIRLRASIKMKTIDNGY
jgi:hypothetical protein